MHRVALSWATVNSPQSLQHYRLITACWEKDEGIGTSHITGRSTDRNSGQVATADKALQTSTFRVSCSRSIWHSFLAIHPSESSNSCRIIATVRAAPETKLELLCASV